MVYSREAALAQIAVFGDRGRVFHGTALISLGQVIVIWLGKAVGEVVQFFRQANGLH